MPGRHPRAVIRRRRDASRDLHQAVGPKRDASVLSHFLGPLSCPCLPGRKATASGVAAVARQRSAERTSIGSTSRLEHPSTGTDTPHQGVR